MSKVFLTNLDLKGNQLLNAVVQPLATAPSSPVLGQIYTDSTDKRIKMYNGEAWQIVGAIIEESSTNGKITVDGVDMTVYTLPAATASSLGGVKVGSGISVAADGTISVDFSTQLNAKADKVTSATSGNFAGLDSNGNLTDSGKKAADFEVAGAAAAVQGDTTTTVEGLEDRVDGIDTIVGKAAVGEDPATGLVKAVADNATEIAKKVDKVEGKGLSSNDYTTEEKTKLAGIAAGAEVNVQSNWTETDTLSDAYILNKPTALSAFTNDENFIDNTVNNLANYYLKTETYTQSEVDGLIAGLALIDIQVVESLPATGSKNIIYLVAKSSSQTQNVYDEFIWTGTAFEKVGDTEIDLSNYLTKTGDGSDVTVAFTAASERANIATGEALDVLMGKIAKYFTDMKTVAFTGNYSDLSGAPTTIKKTTDTMAAGATTKTVTVTDGTQILAVTLVDATTKELLTADVTVNGATATVTISSAYAKDISIIVAYM